MASLEEFRSYHSPLKDFYEGKTILLTGGSGFIGKLLIEKLVKCNVAEILLILRRKKGVEPTDRLEKLLGNEPVFVNFAKQPELYRSRIRIIAGDMNELGAGVANDDMAYVCKHTDIIVHAAADVRFDEPLRSLIHSNVRGTREMLKIAEQCTKLRIFMYISTAFSHCVREEIGEKFYEPKLDPALLITLAERESDGDALDLLSVKLIEPWPNAYAFTKSLSEEIIRRYSSKLPVAIIRPSIITTTKEDPLAGWTDNLYGFNGVVCGAACGVLRIFHIHMDYKASIVPADIVINGTLAAAWYAAGHPQEENVFNCTTDENPVSWRDTERQLEKWKDRVVFDKSLWITTYNTTHYQLIADILAIFYHVLPALLFDLVLRLRGQKPQVLRLYQKVHRFSAVLRFFTNNEWRFRGDRMRTVLNALTADDQRYFPCDPKAIPWNEFLDDQIKGLRVYMMRDPMESLKWTLPRHRKRMLAHRCLLVLIYGGLFYLALYVADALGLHKLLQTPEHDIADVGDELANMISA
ncbi:fatty acyl-CoA reductase wat-like [Anopheles albimanus]|uniref:fatty acyl-CoA reductase wat-like n=1 Tax=Anopheles albimanus TaxID=7167 RepID=UPI001640D251|nr:fatty acyl-CoA reductase wat-like [Anopheles albimanus]